MTTEYRFLLHVDKGGPNGCWIWTSNVNKKGYGAFKIKNRNHKAHRVSYELFAGTIPDGMFVLHKCDNPSCVNPEHLFVGTNADNMRDMTMKHRHHGNGIKGESSALAKITESDVRAIRRLVASGSTQRSMAKRFGLKEMEISRIVRRQRWAHVE